MLNIQFSRIWISLAIAFTPISVFSVNPSSHDDSTLIQQSFESQSDISKIHFSELKTPGDVLIFISFSIPPTSLKQWFIQADKIQAPLIIRGLVNHSFQDTQAILAEVAPNHKNGVIMDPRLFQTYQIQTVPAVVVRDTSVSCASGESCVHLYPYDMVYGDVELAYALQTINNQGNNTSSITQHALQQLRETHS